MHKPQPALARLSPAGWLARLHRDERGNLAILLILTIWALVALIALVWNSAEYATRKRHAQNAADAMAHAGNTWVSRTTNLTAATNLLISENGSAEVIRRAVEPTRSSIQRRFDRESARARQLRDAENPGQPDKGIPDCEYFEELLGFGAWSGNGRGDQRLKDLRQLSPEVLQALNRILRIMAEPERSRLQQEVVEGIRKNEVGLSWLVETWINGGPGKPPAPGAGLKKDVGDWITNEVRPRLEDILATLAVEQAWLDRWTAQTDPAMGTSSEQLQSIREQIHDDFQNQIRDLTPQAVEEQREKLADFYKTDLTTATPGRPVSAGPAPVNAPIRPAGEVQAWPPHADSIRQRYSQQAIDRFKFDPDPLNVKIDPINVNVGQGVPGGPDSVIWHPGQRVQSPPGITLDKQVYDEWYNVGGGEWGRVPCAPLSRFFNDRVYRDREGLREEPKAIDGARDELRGRVHPPPSPPTIPTLPNQIEDPLPGPPPAPGQPPAPPRTISVPPPRLPRLPTPVGLTPAEIAAIEALNVRIAQYNQDVNEYVSDLRGLGGPQQNLMVDRMFQNLRNLTDLASQRFADDNWLRHVESARRLVLDGMGWSKKFMVLKTYELREIPEWARSNMRQSVQAYVYQKLYDANRARLEVEARRRLREWAERILGAAEAASVAAGNPPGPRGAMRSRAQQFADANAPRLADFLASQGSRGASEEVAEEWVRRPWPFEIEPPTESVPPTRGLSDDERKNNFTFLAAAKTTDDSGAKPFLPAVFAPGKPMVAYAQGETFNWMEYHRAYGAAPEDSSSGDHFDQIVRYGHGDLGGSPRPWRLSTTGGWNWQPRLALSDALDMAITDAPEFQEFFDESGVTGTDPEAFKKLPMH